MEIIRINLDKPLESLDGTPDKDSKLSRILGNWVWAAEGIAGIDSIKCNIIAKTLYRDGYMELNVTEIDHLKTWLDGLKSDGRTYATYPQGIKGQITEEIINQKLNKGSNKK